ncbi:MULTISPECIES: hypothetical protein [unclassified Rhodosalinus]|uniref:hypothetical protein n=1 Tax=unclassified Rhodosalinus TaxID=2630183 RepID=UPI0035238BF4
MGKLIAIANVVAWSGFWAFGYLALAAAGELSGGQIAVAALLAFAGLATGVTCWLWLARAAEATGYAKPSKQLTPQARARAQEQGEVRDALS